VNQLLEGLARLDPDWHRAQAEIAEREGEHYAAAFHLGRLLCQYPWDADLHSRHAHALAHQGKTAEATLHLIQALILLWLEECGLPAGGHNGRG